MGRFPKLRRHALLKMAPLPLHRAATDWRYTLGLVRRSDELLMRGLRRVVRKIRTAVVTAWRLIAAMAVMLVNREERVRRCHAELCRWIEQEQQLGRLTARQADRLHESLRNEQVADLAGLFCLHLMAGGVKQAVLGPSVLWVGAAVGTGQWWLLAPAFVSPALRVTAALWVGLWRKPEVVLFSALPTVGVLAAPVCLLRRKTELGALIIRCTAQRAALRIPGFGERGSLAEIGAVAAAQIFLIDVGRLLPPLLLLALVAVLTGHPLIAAAILALYPLAALVQAFRWRRHARGDALEGWRLGLPTANGAAARLVREEDSAPSPAAVSAAPVAG